jgi:Flp pilus assembly protein TadG
MKISSALNHTCNVFSRYKACQKGSVAIVAALALLPIVAVSGAALDYSRASEIKTKIQQAADAAVLAAAKTTGTDADRIKVGQEVFKANTLEIAGLGLTPVFSKITEGMKVSISGKSPSVFVSAMGIASSTFNVVSQAQMTSGDSAVGSGERVEIALALDTTGSMKSDMSALHAAANSLTDEVMKSSNIYVSVVPFVAAVNVGATNIPMGMMDTQANSKWHGQFMKNNYAGSITNCTTPGVPHSGGGGHAPTGTGKVEGSLPLFQKFAHISKELFGISSAKAADITPNTIWPYAYSKTVSHAWGASTAQLPVGFQQLNNPSAPSVIFPGDQVQAYYYCILNNPAKVSHFDLFNRIPGAKWKGCVEARPAPYDIDDTVPSASNPDTLFVPYFAMDEQDDYIYQHGSEPRSNNYLPDHPPAARMPTGWNPGLLKWEHYLDNHIGFTNIIKYDGIATANIKETPPNTKGPNRSCPDELLRLTNNKSDVKNKINSLSYWGGGGTFASEGVMWAWRTLAPNAPFSDGKEYKKNEKIIVLMSDGVNEISMNEGNAAGSTFYAASDYSAYGYLWEDSLWQGRLKPMSAPTFSEMSKFLDTKMDSACTNAKANGIKIYTVMFREANTTAINNMKKCATKTAMAYKASNQTELKKAFEDIGKDISENYVGQGDRLRLTK